MKILAIDTATERCSVALWVHGEVLEQQKLLNRAHAEVILPMVDQLLSESGSSLRELDGIAFGRGPGGFTGVRVAVSVAQGLAFGAELPVLPVSDLAAVAAAAQRLHDAQRVLVCMDARMREVYWGAYSVEERGLAVLDGEHLSSPEQVAVPEPVTWYGAGSGFLAYGEALQARLGSSLGGLDSSLLPSACDVGRLAAEAYVRGEYLPAEQALPVYLRDQVAWPKPAV